MRVILLVATMLVGCGDDGEPTLAERCREIADDFCCGLDDSASCETGVNLTSCQLIGGQGGCAGGDLCIRSSVDFDACKAALDAIGTCVAEPCGTTPTQTCTPLPAACRSAPCASASDGCAEEANK